MEEQDRNTSTTTHTKVKHCIMPTLSALVTFETLIFVSRHSLEGSVAL